MSIIEKAVNRLDRSKGEPAAEPAHVPTDGIVAGAARLDHADAEKKLPPVAVQDTGVHARTMPAPTPAPAPAPAPAVSPAVAPVAAPKTSAKRIEISMDRLAAKNMVTADGGRNPVAEEFRAIKRPLIDNAFAENGRVTNRNNLIMVTSALPGEGKTFTAINLAISIAMELDHTVLLIDADVARPAVLQTLGLKSEQGLMDILLDAKLDVSDVMLKTNIDTLSILPAGKNTRHATELLASQTMSTLLDEIASRYPDRIVIFDSPPLLLTSEARVLAAQMGQIVVVVEAETTTMHAVKGALSQLENCPNVNLVYNKARSFPGEEDYGYYYN